jgi:K+-transporting ATPase ATPase A chain
MEISSWIQLGLFVGILLLLARPLGSHLYKVLESRERTIFSPALGGCEKWLFKILGPGSKKEQDWKQYGLALAFFSLVGMLLTYVILRLQHIMPLNPQHVAAMDPSLAFNTAASFASNTNWQNYAGERTLSHFSQMVGLTFQNFASAAAGIAVAAVLVRGVVRKSAATIGNFWQDLIRITIHLLLPLSFVLAIFFLSQGVIQNFKADVKVSGLENADGRERIQFIPQGPVASQEAIKMLGTNGGGFFNANSAHPYENPTPLTNFVQMLAIFLIPGGLTRYLGLMTGNKKHGWAVLSAMLILFLASLLVCWTAESKGNPRFQNAAMSGGGNMEGKETRFGIFNSALFATVTTAASCGAINAMHDSFTPLGGLMPMLNIQLGEVVFGGVGSGLYGMLVFVILAVFIAGLMVGRTPEYLGKKIGAADVKLCAFYVLVSAMLILAPAAWATVSRWGTVGLGNHGPHGLSEILYAYSSVAGNNGSAFAGYVAASPMGNIILGLVMVAGRFLLMVPVLVLAGNLAAKKTVPSGSGSFPVHGATFIVILIGTIIIVGLLTFFPALSLGPVVEHFIMIHSGTLF